MKKSPVTMAQATEASGIIETALTCEEALRVAITINAERHGPSVQLAGLCLALKSIQNEKFPELSAVLKSVPKRTLKDYEIVRSRLQAAMALAHSKGTMQ